MRSRGVKNDREKRGGNIGEKQWSNVQVGQRKDRGKHSRVFQVSSINVTRSGRQLELERRIKNPVKPANIRIAFTSVTSQISHKAKLPRFVKKQQVSQIEKRMLLTLFILFALMYF